MAKRLRVGVVFGGRSGEHEVSLISAASVLGALDRSRYEVVPVGIAPDGRWISSQDALTMLRDKVSLDRETEHVLIPKPNRQSLVAATGDQGIPLPLDVIFPVVHGTYGEDGSLQGLLELADIPYVGAGVLGSSVGMDKIVQKQLFEREGLRVPKYTWFDSAAAGAKQMRVVATSDRLLQYPMFVNPANTGSSVGISKAHNRKELRDAIAVATAYDRRIIVEHGIADTHMGEDDCAERLLELLKDATRIRLRSDVPVGAYLSGGRDSSVITSLIKEFSGARLKTFSVGFEDSEFDESGYQRDVIELLRTDHDSVRCSYQDICNVFPDVVWIRKNPFCARRPRRCTCSPGSFAATVTKWCLRGKVRMSFSEAMIFSKKPKFAAFGRPI